MFQSSNYPSLSPWAAGNEEGCDYIMTITVILISKNCQESFLFKKKKKPVQIFGVVLV